MSLLNFFYVHCTKQAGAILHPGIHNFIQNPCKKFSLWYNKNVPERGTETIGNLKLMKEVLIMKALPKNFASTLYNNLNEVNFVQTIRKNVTAFYNDTPDQPTSFFNDDGDRILMKDVINVSVNDNNLYIEVLNDLVVIYRPNKTERRYVSVDIFEVDNYKNTTSLSMAIAIRIMKYYNDLLL